MKVTVQEPKQHPRTFSNSVSVTGRFLICIIGCVSLVGFGIGREYRLLLGHGTTSKKESDFGIQGNVAVDGTFSCKLSDPGQRPKDTWKLPPEEDEEGDPSKGEPSAYLLTIDVCGLDKSHLESSDRLKETILKIVQSKALPPKISLHCQSHRPEQKVCVGTSSESQIIVHTCECLLFFLTVIRPAEST